MYNFQGSRYNCFVINLQQSFFQKEKIKHLNADIIFVSDFFVNEYSGGAELTSQALIESIPKRFTIASIKSSQVSLEFLHLNQDKFYIFGNWTQLNSQVIPSIIANLKYVVLEYDYKYCKHRSTEKHFILEKVPCDCHNTNHGKMVSAFYYASKGLFWMSQKQMEKYHTYFPFLKEKFNLVLSSVFDKQTLEYIRELRNNAIKNNDWIILGSDSWVKGFDNAKQYVDNNNLQYEIVWNIEYKHLLRKLANSYGHVYLPAGDDTCPRLTIEAKLLDCKLVLNDCVQHKNESWFNTDDIDKIESYLSDRPSVFWNHIQEMIDYVPTVSGYTTTFNCIEQKYPYIQSIRSMLGFCDEICVVDGGSSDGTWESLVELSQQNTKIKIQQIKRDWNDSRSAVFDGLQKAEARKLCTKEFCWQLDVDEVIHEQHYDKIKTLCSMMPNGVDLMCLPVVEGWGTMQKIRLDVNNWKWRLSRNKQNITHGIPKSLRAYDNEGKMYALMGTDGCDMIFKDSGEIVPNINYWNNELENIRIQALQNNTDALNAYEQIMNQIYRDLPSVWHYSWVDIERKIKTYKQFWQRHWNSLFNVSLEDTPENNMFFDCSWSDVTDDMIKEKAVELSEQCCGHIFHSKWKGQYTPGIKITSIDEPKIMQEK